MKRIKKSLVVAFVLSTIALMSTGCEKANPVSIKWSISTGRNNTSHFFEIVDDVLYVSYMSGNLYAIDKHTGKEKWKYSDRDGGFISCSIASGVVYLLSWDESANIEEQTYLYAIASEDSKLIWDYNLSGNGWYLLGIETENRPILAYGNIYIAGPDNHVYAIDTESHELLWRFSTEFESIFSDVHSVISVADEMVYFFSKDYFYVVNAITGELKSQWTAESIEESRTWIRTATVTDGVAYINAYFFENDKEKNYLYAIDIKKGEFKWKYEADGVDFPPAINNGVIYFGSRDHYLYALDVDTGELHWKYKMRGIAMSSPTVVDDIVYVGCLENRLYTVDAQSGELLWKYRTTDAVHSSIIVEDDIIYFGTSDGYLYALENTSESQ